MGIAVQLHVSTIRRALALTVAPKDMYDTVLNLLGNIRKVHVVTAAGWAFHLALVTVVLIETLKTLDKDKVHSEPC